MTAPGSQAIKTLLIAPPHFFLQNSLGIPQLTAYLRSKGHDVEQKLVDCEIFDFLLSPSEMQVCFERIRTRLPPSMEADSHLRQEINDGLRSFSETNPILPMFGIDLSRDDILEQVLAMEQALVPAIAGAMAFLRETFVTQGLDMFFRNMGPAWLGTKLVSLAWYPSTFDLFDGIGMRYSSLKVDDICRAVEDRDENLLMDYYERNLYDWIREQEPRILGLQINTEGQLIPAFTLLNWVRQNLPDTFTIVGGTLMSFLCDQIKEEERLWDFFHAIGLGMGEYTLDGLIDHFEGGMAFSEVPNLVYREGKELVATPTVRVDMDDIQTPEFPETRPGAVLPLYTAAGCSWGRCAFCEYPYINKPEDGGKTARGYYPRSMDRVLDDIEKLDRTHEPMLFFLSDSDVHPNRLKQMAKGIRERGLKIRFQILGRAEKAFLDLEFCKELADAGLCGAYIGLEAGSQRINDIMNKGIEVAVVEQVLRNFHQVGITNSLFVMIGTPTETREEVEQTRLFLERNREVISGDISFFPFLLPVCSQITFEPERFGIKRILPRQEGELRAYLGYEVEEGLSHQQSNEVRDELLEALGIPFTGGQYLFEIIKKAYPGENPPA